MPIPCKVCDKAFESDKGLHVHISRAHKIPLPEYYVNLYQRKDRYTNKLLSFKNKEEYFGRDFADEQNLMRWSKGADPDEVRSYLLQQLKQRIDTKELSYGPTHLELRLHDLPSIDMYKDFFGSYSKACDKLKIKPLFGKNIMKGFFEKDKALDSINILVDTREQQPLRFNKSTPMKLDFGDYAIGAPYYDYTYVDRKSESDFKSTMTTGFKRFTRELERTAQFDAYLFIVVESSIDKIKKNNLFGPHTSNMPYVWHNMRLLTHKFARQCQFVFSGGRAASQEVIPKLLVHGRKLWESDLQHFIDKQ
jgi:hypothetical protein